MTSYKRGSQDHLIFREEEPQASGRGPPTEWGLEPGHTPKRALSPGTSPALPASLPAPIPCHLSLSHAGPLSPSLVPLKIPCPPPFSALAEVELLTCWKLLPKPQQFPQTWRPHERPLDLYPGYTRFSSALQLDLGLSRREQV